VAYLIAAYTLVIGALVAYGGWVQGQRRRLMRQVHRGDPDEPDA
jgi:hypothetical protein